MKSLKNICIKEFSLEDFLKYEILNDDYFIKLIKEEYFHIDNCIENLEQDTELDTFYKMKKITNIEDKLSFLREYLKEEEENRLADLYEYLENNPEKADDISLEERDLEEEINEKNFEEHLTCLKKDIQDKIEEYFDVSIHLKNINEKFINNFLIKQFKEKVINYINIYINRHGSNDDLSKKLFDIFDKRHIDIFSNQTQTEITDLEDLLSIST